MATEYKLGKNAVLYFGQLTTNGARIDWGGTVTAGVNINTAPTNLASIGGVVDVTLKIEKETTNVDTRDNAGWGADAATLKRGSLAVKLIDQSTTDAGQTALLGNFLDSTGALLPIAALSGLATNSGSAGLWADTIVSGWERGEPIKDAQTITCEIKVSLSSVPTQWVQVP